MTAKEERNEDLNPRSSDLDEKIRQLLDPSIPDPKPEAEAPKVSAAEPKITEVAGKSSLASVEITDTPDTAAEVALPVKKERKVIVPVFHEETPEEPKPAKAKKKEAKPAKKPVVKIAVDHHEETKEELAEKLDAAIADLSLAPEIEEVPEPEETPEVVEEDKTDEAEQPTAPLLDGVEEETEEEPVEEEAATVPEEQPAKPEAPKSPPKSVKVDEEPPLPKPKVVEDPETDAVVKDIVATESDELLEVEDAVREAEQPEPKAKRQFRLKPKTVLKLFVWLIVLTTAGVMAYPTSRYIALNTVGLRSSSSVKILDDSTQQPLKQVKVELGGQEATTDADGVARFSNLKLGATTIRVSRIAFATLEKPITLGWGSNPLDDIALKATGARYKLSVVDTFSGKPIAGAVAEADDVSAKADEKGIITLTVSQTEKHDVAVTIKAPSYRDEQVTVKADFKDTTAIKLSPSDRHVFTTKRSGKFDIYTVYADGKGEKLLLAGSGNEREDMALLPRTQADEVAYVSTRAGKRSADGTLLSDLILISRDSGRTTPVATAERIQLVGWSDERLLFVSVAGSDKATDPKRSRLLSYTLSDGKTTEIAASNYFNDLLLARGQVYYAPSSTYPGGSLAQWLRAGADGSSPKAVLEQEVWALVRTGYDRIAASAGQDWYDYAIGDSAAKKLSGPPSSQQNRLYIDAPGGQKSAWVDQRDGKGVLIVYDVAGKQDTVLVTRAGLVQPVSWLNASTLVLRVESTTETADYVVSLNGGEPQKVRDVTKTSAIDNWYQY